jgi:hypothetical protein
VVIARVVLKLTRLAVYNDYEVDGLDDIHGIHRTSFTPIFSCLKAQEVGHQKHPQSVYYRSYSMWRHPIKQLFHFLLTLRGMLNIRVRERNPASPSVPSRMLKYSRNVCRYHPGYIWQLWPQTVPAPPVPTITVSTNVLGKFRVEICLIPRRVSHACVVVDKDDDIKFLENVKWVFTLVKICLAA